MKRIIALLSVLALAACTDAEIEKQLALEGSDEGYGPNYESAVSFEGEQSYLIALQRLETSKLRPSMGWDVDAEIVGRFPIYMSGLEDQPSYYEYKVMSGGQDAGYILVNVDETDIPIPQMATEGLTLTENYVDEVYELDFKVYRHGFFESSAKVADGLGERIIASLGRSTGGRILVDEELREMPEVLDRIRMHEDGYRSSLLDRGTIPAHRPEKVQQIYDSVPHDLSFDRVMRAVAHKRQQLSIANSDEVGPYFLKHTFDNGWHIPDWGMSKRNGEKVGCGPTSTSQLLAYWHTFKNRRALFNFTDLPDEYSRGADGNTGLIPDTQWELGGILQTHFDDTNSWTGWWNMDQVTDFVSRRGYPGVDFVSVYNSTVQYRQVYDFTRDRIKADNPVIILIDADGNGMLSHYVNVEGVMKEEDDGWWDAVWYGYFVNWGWGNNQPRTWIYDGVAADDGNDQNSHETAHCEDAYQDYIYYKSKEECDIDGWCAIPPQYLSLYHDAVNRWEECGEHSIWWAGALKSIDYVPFEAMYTLVSTMPML